MNAELTQFLVDLTRGPLGPHYRADPAAVLASAPIEQPLRDAIQAADIAMLWCSGAHPMALLYFSRFCGWSGEQYYSCVAAADRDRVVSVRR